jgi:hypothetical protein
VNAGITVSSNTVNGIYATTEPWTIQNFGSIAGNAATSAGDGIDLRAGGSVTNQSSASVSGYTGIYGLGATTVVNSCSILGNTASALSDGVHLEAGGVVTNQSGGSIIGVMPVSAEAGERV